MIETFKKDFTYKGSQYYISLYDLKNDKYKILNKNFSYNLDFRRYKINHFFKMDKYLFAKYENCLDIYDIEKNMKFINETDYKILNKDLKKK